VSVVSVEGTPMLHRLPAPSARKANTATNKGLLHVLAARRACTASATTTSRVRAHSAAANALREQARWSARFYPRIAPAVRLARPALKAATASIAKLGSMKLRTATPALRALPAKQAPLTQAANNLRVTASTA
jgi:hypothetical protein